MVDTFVCPTIEAYRRQLIELRELIVQLEQEVAAEEPGLLMNFRVKLEELNQGLNSLAHLANAAGREGTLIPSNGNPL